MTLATLAVGSHNTRKTGFDPLFLDFPHVPWDDADALVEVIEREGPETIAGFIAEPITGAAGACLTASDEYWQVVTDICHRYDILMITDEVMCGYGRTGLNFGFQHFPFEPDVIVGGKGLGGGYVPMGAVAARDEVAAVLANAGFMYFTFTGNDAACAASVAVLDIMEREGPGRAGRQDGGGARRSVARRARRSPCRRRRSRPRHVLRDRAQHPAAASRRRGVVARCLGVSRRLRAGAECGDGRAAIRHHRRRARSGRLDAQGIARHRDLLGEAHRRCHCRVAGCGCGVQR